MSSSGDDRDELKTRHWALAFVALFLAVVIPGAVYWNQVGFHLARCMYGDPVCSLAISTYLLCVITVCAFLAAYRAIRFASQTLAMESEVILSINRCFVPMERAQKPRAADRRAIAPEHRVYREEHRYIRTIAQGFEMEKPNGFTKTAYKPIEFDCSCVGRSALINGTLEIESTSPNGDVHPLRIDIGSIPANENVLLRLWISTALARVQFAWKGQAINRTGNAFASDIELNAREPRFGIETEAKAENTKPPPIPPMDQRVDLP